VLLENGSVEYATEDELAVELEAKRSLMLESDFGMTSVGGTAVKDRVIGAGVSDTEEELGLSGRTAVKDQVIEAGVSDEDEDSEELAVTLVTNLVTVMLVVD